MNTSRFPLYRSHKTVQAAKITAIEMHGDGSATIAPADYDIDVFQTNPGWADRWKGSEEDPGYYVRYEDGYESWSPTKAFEEGYTRV